MIHQKNVYHICITKVVHHGSKKKTDGNLVVRHNCSKSNYLPRRTRKIVQVKAKQKKRKINIFVCFPPLFGLAHMTHKMFRSDTYTCTKPFAVMQPNDFLVIRTKWLSVCHTNTQDGHAAYTMRGREAAQGSGMGRVSRRAGGGRGWGCLPGSGLCMFAGRRE